MISFVVYSSERITSYSVNMVRWAGRASLVIMNQEEKGLNTYTSKNSNNVSCAVSDTALAKAALITLFETCFSTLLVDTCENDKEIFVKKTVLGGAMLYKFTFKVKVAIISVLWEILIKLITTLIWQKRHDDQCTVMTGDISFLKTMNMYRGEWSPTYSSSPEFRVAKVMVANLIKLWVKMWSIVLKKS